MRINEKITEAFAKALRDKSSSVRASAINVLKKCKWKPSNDIDRALFILLTDDTCYYNPELASLGQAAIEAIRIANNFEWEQFQMQYDYKWFNESLIRTIEFLRIKGLVLDETPEEIIAGARPYLCQSNNPESDRKIADGLIKTPKETIRAIKNRGWSGRGHEDEALNDFLVRLLGRIFSEFEDKEIRSDVIETLIKIFEEPDDRTSGRTCLIELAIEILAERKIKEARKRLNEIKIGENMSTINTINYVLSKEW